MMGRRTTASDQMAGEYSSANNDALSLWECKKLWNGLATVLRIERLTAPPTSPAGMKNVTIR